MKAACSSDCTARGALKNECAPCSPITNFENRGVSQRGVFAHAGVSLFPRLYLFSPLFLTLCGGGKHTSWFGSRALNEERAPSGSRLFFDNRSRILVVSQSSKLCMAQMARFSPFQEFNLRHQFGIDPNTFLHLLGCQSFLSPYLQKVTLRNFRTVDAANLFAEIHRRHGIGRTTLHHCKSQLSGLFTLARNQGALDSPNPIEGAMIPKKAAAPSKTHAATPDEVMAILDLLEKAGEWKARAAVGLMFFAGLRPGEARGARWEDYQGKRLFVQQSVWHTFTTSPKTEGAASPVPVIETLADILGKL